MTRSSTTDLPPIDPEELAAFADGRLRGEARDALVARLARDCEARELLADVIAVRDEVEEDLAAAGEDAAEPAAEPTAERTAEPARKGRLLRGPWTRRAWAGVAAAAAAVIALVVAPRLLVPAPDLQRLAGEVHLEEGELAAIERPVWSATRGGAPVGDFDGFGPRESFRWGVRAVDFQVALRSGDPDRLASAAHAADRLLEGTDFQGQYPRIAFLDPHQARREGAALAEAAIESPAVDDFFFRYGMWTRAAWLAAVAGEVDFFRSRAGRSLRSLDPPEDDSDELAAEIRDLRRRVAAVAEGEEEVPSLESALWAVLEERSRR